MIEFLGAFFVELLKAALEASGRYTRYAVLYDDRRGELLGYVDLGEKILLGPGQKIEFDFDAPNIRIETLP